MLSFCRAESGALGASDRRVGGVEDTAVPGGAEGPLVSHAG